MPNVLVNNAMKVKSSVCVPSCSVVDKELEHGDTQNLALGEKYKGQ